jgi:hypothetical protein
MRYCAGEGVKPLTNQSSQRVKTSATAPRSVKHGASRTLRLAALSALAAWAVAITAAGTRPITQSEVQAGTRSKSIYPHTAQIDPRSVGPVPEAAGLVGA